MIASARTVQQLLNRLPAPRRATLADLGAVAAMLARARLTPQPHTAALAARLTPQPHTAALAARLTELHAWADHADRHLATDRRNSA